MGKHCNNSQCFKEKNYKAKFLIGSILKNIKSTKTILEKIIKKSHRKHCNNSQCFKKKLQS